MNNGQQQLQQTKSERIDHSITIEDNGEVTIVNTQKEEYHGTYLQFNSEYNMLKQQKEQIENALSEETRKVNEENLDKINKEIERLEPFIKESEEKTKAFYEEQKFQGMLKKVSEELDKKMSDINTGYLSAVWENLIQNEQKVLDSLTDEQKSKFVKIKLRAMQNKRKHK